jgi:ABC-type phosphate transport system auxiliary subunit
MKEQVKDWAARDPKREKLVYWTMTGCGGMAMVIGVVSIAVLAVAGMFLLITAVGSLLVGRFLLRNAREWRQRHPINGNTAKA